MDFLPSALAGLAGFAFGWVAARYQHNLYRQAEHRADRATGRKLLVIRLLLVLSCGAVGTLAFRPDHYDAGPAFLTTFFGWALLVLASTDFERRLLPNRLMYPALLAAVLLAWAWPDRNVLSVLAGGAIAAVIGAALFVFGEITGSLLGVRAAAFGFGDVKLIVLLGLLCGWPAVFTALLYGIVLAGVVSLVLILRGRSKAVFSYGPYLVAGGLVVLLWPEAFI
jgi:prepilin signal peptidase PulO-like enzyme (type II secretory pathway)